MDYNELVQKRQEGVIDDLEFLLAQKDLAEIYLEDMKSRERGPIMRMPSSGYVNMRITIYTNSYERRFSRWQSTETVCRPSWFKNQGGWAWLEKALVLSGRWRGLPQNIEGRVYNGINLFMLYLSWKKRVTAHHCIWHSCKLRKPEPHNYKRREKSFPVIYWNFQ